jgi:hypothetical protein
MSKYPDPKVGDKYNKWTVIEVCLGKLDGHKIKVQCECGTIQSPRYTDDILSGHSRSCGHCNNPKVGDQIGTLTVVEVIPAKAQGCKAKARCSCGKITKLMSGSQLKRMKTCGHCNLPKPGNKYHQLEILEVSGGQINGGGRIMVKCLCDCGNIITTKFNSIQTNNTKTCGQCNTPSVGDKIRSWTITQVVPVKPHGSRVSAICQCGTIRNNVRVPELGNTCGLCSIHIPSVGDTHNAMTITEITSVTPGIGCRVKAKCNCGKQWGPGNSYQITHGNVKSCGKCKISGSLGNYTIDQLLKQHDVSFIREHTFENCVNKAKLWFDFYLIGCMCIEYQGPHHYRQVANWDFQRTQENDQIKRDYCKANDIELYEIPYTYFNELPEIIEDLVVRDLLWIFDYPKVELTCEK